MGDLQIDLVKKAQYINDENKLFNQSGLANAIKERYGISSLHGNMYCVEGVLDMEALQHEITDLLDLWGVKNNIPREVKTLCELIQMKAYNPDLPIPAWNEIPVANGTVIVTEGEIQFLEEKRPTVYRLPIKYNKIAPRPAYFLDNFIPGLFHPEDIAGFQEIMGYCLIPSTRYQKAFFIIGAGGEGKSIIGWIMFQFLGNAFVGMKFHAIEEDRFAVANSENKLAAFDDDMQQAKLKATAKVKTFITAKVPIEGERKGIQKFQFLPFAKLVVCSNYPISTLYDTSDAFFRRIYAIRVKNRPIDRIDISDFELPMLGEMEGIFLWALEGLKRLIRQDRFSESERSKELVQGVKEESNPFILFLEQEVEFDGLSKIASSDLYKAYVLWSDKNGYFTKAQNIVLNYLHEREELLNIKYLPKAVGNKRGFKGIKLKNNLNLDLDKLLREDNSNE